MKRHPVAGTVDRARRLRRFGTDAERKLWSVLRGRQLDGSKFRRQQRLGPYFADFACLEVGLVIEADGSQHADQVAYDEERTRFLNGQGYRVLRFWNHEVLTNLEGVTDVIRAALRSPFSLRGEGGAQRSWEGDLSAWRMAGSSSTQPNPLPSPRSLTRVALSPQGRGKGAARDG